MREPEHTIMTRQGKAADAAMSASAWSTSGTLFAAVRRLYTWCLAWAGVMPTTGTIATTADLPSAGTNDFNATCKASINTEVDTALDTTIPGANTADSVNDILLDQIKPVLPASTIAAATDLISGAAVDFGAVAKASINTEVDTALDTAIPGANTADSVNDILLDQIKPVLPASTIAAATDLISGAAVDFGAVAKASITAAVKLAQTVTAKTMASIATGNLFTISGGPIRLLGFVGLIDTIIETKANASNIQFTPTGGAATDLCAVLDITGSAAGLFFTITGTKANAMAVSADGGIVVSNLAAPLVLSTGTIKMTCADTSTGAITWYMVYEAMSPASAVAAA